MYRMHIKCTSLRRLAATGGALVCSAVYAAQAAGRIDEGEVRKCLGKIAQLPLGRRVVLFRQQADIVTQRDQAIKQGLRIVIAPQQGIIVG